MFFLLSKLLDFLLSPAVWVVGVLLAGLLLPNRRGGRRLCWGALGLLALLTNPALVNEALLAWERPPVALAQLFPFGCQFTIFAYDNDTS